MQVYKTFFKIIHKNKVSLIIYFVLFLTLTMLLSSSGKENSTLTFSQNKLSIAVIDRDNTELSKGLSDYLGTIHKLVDIEDDKTAMQDNLYYRNVTYILIIPEGFEQNILDGTMEDIVENVKVPNSYNGTFVDQQVNQYLKVLNTYLQSGSSPTEALSLTSKIGSENTTVTFLNHDTKTVKKSIFYYFQYLPYIFICVMLDGLGPILLVYNKKELSDRMEASSLSLKAKNFQIILGCITFLLVTWLLFMLPASIIYSESFFSEIGFYLITNSLIFAIVCIGITLIASLLVKTSNVLNMVGNTVGLGMSFLCGIFVPREIMDPNVINISKLLPGYWYIDVENVLYDFTGSQEQLTRIFLCYGVQILFALALISMALLITKLKRTR